MLSREFYKNSWLNSFLLDVGVSPRERDDKFGRRIETSFGSVRLDLPATEDRRKSSSSVPGLNPIDEEYFGSYFKDESCQADAESRGSLNPVQKETSVSRTPSQEQLNPVDEAYFGSYFHHERSSYPDGASSTVVVSQEAERTDQPELNEVDGQYFGSYFRQEPQRGTEQEEFVGMGLFGGGTNVVRFGPPATERASEQYADILRPKRQPELVTESSWLGVPVAEPKRDLVDQKPVQEEENVSAFDFAVKSRLEQLKAKGDGQKWFGFDYNKMTREEVCVKRDNPRTNRVILLWRLWLFVFSCLPRFTDSSVHR